MTNHTAAMVVMEGVRCDGRCAGGGVIVALLPGVDEADRGFWSLGGPWLRGTEGGAGQRILGCVTCVRPGSAREKGSCSRVFLFFVFLLCRCQTSR